MSLNAEQLQAVTSNSDRILCLAGAGAGKTRVMIDRISRLVGDGVAPSSILTLTFTNAAAAEMKERYEKSHIGEETPEFRTFHSFCYSILCRDSNIRHALGYNDIPAIASDEQDKNIKERALVQCKINLSKDKLTHRNNLTKQEQFQADLYDKAVRKIMRSDNVITFDALNNDVAELFASDNVATHYYKNKYKYILIDECQDTDPYQMKFLNSFQTTDFYFTGDCLQNIYSFRGTSNAYIKAIANADGWEKIRLFTNYRSTNQICEYANKFSKKYADESYRIEMQGTRDGDRVITKLTDGGSKYSCININDVCDVVNTLDTLSGTSAILCRTNKEVNAVTNYLRDNDIDFTSNKDNRIQRLIDCAVSDTYMLGLMASYLSSDKYGEYIRLSSQVSNPDLNWFLGMYGNTPQIKADVKIINELKRISKDFGFTNAKLSEVEKLLNIKNIPKPDREYFGEDFLHYLQESITDIKSSELYVGTIHSVKGLEYDNVFVMNVGSYSFKLNTEDEKNLFYVAVTRAKNRLYIYELFDN